MHITPEQARENLAQINETVARTNRVVAYKGMDYILYLWGAIWIVGYLVSQYQPLLQVGDSFYPLYSQMTWGVLIPLGLLATWAISRKMEGTKGEREKRQGRRIGAMWGLLYGYVNVVAMLLAPFIQISSSEEGLLFWGRMNVIAGIIPMFAYVMMGLMLENTGLLLIGLLITVLAVAGVYIVPMYACLWMAGAGGGVLILSGLWVRRVAQ
jgi:hypothetical protein